MKFFTTQSDLTRYNGMRICWLAPLRPSEYDKEDVGDMFKIQLENGVTIDCFEDEIIGFGEDL